MPAKSHLLPIRRFLVIDLDPHDAGLHTIKLSTDSHHAAGAYIDAALEPCALIDTLALTAMARVVNGEQTKLDPAFTE